jgi:hypothetical protein
MIIFNFEKLSLRCGGQAFTSRLTKGGWTLQKGMAVKKGGSISRESELYL